MHGKPLPSEYIFVRLRKEKGRQEKAREKGRKTRWGEGKDMRGKTEALWVLTTWRPPPFSSLVHWIIMALTGLATRHYSRNCGYGNEEYRVCLQEAPSLGGVGEGGHKEVITSESSKQISVYHIVTWGGRAEGRTHTKPAGVEVF